MTNPTGRSALTRMAVAAGLSLGLLLALAAFPAQALAQGEVLLDTLRLDLDMAAGPVADDSTRTDESSFDLQQGTTYRLVATGTVRWHTGDPSDINYDAVWCHDAPAVPNCRSSGPLATSTLWFAVPSLPGSFQRVFHTLESFDEVAPAYDPSHRYERTYTPTATGKLHVRHRIHNTPVATSGGFTIEIYGPPQAQAQAPAGVGVGAVAGTIFGDGNANGRRDAGEPGASGGTVLVDYNGNGAADDGEPSATSGPSGAYAISGVRPGSWTLRLAIPSSFRCTFPNPCAHRIVVPATGTYDFGVARGAAPGGASGAGFLDISRSQRALSRGGLRMTVNCPVACLVDGVARVGRRTVGGVDARVRAGTRRTLTLRFSRTGRALIRNRRRRTGRPVVVNVAITFLADDGSDAAGQTIRTTVRVR